MSVLNRIEPLSPASLNSAVHGKRVLIVGGTAGIGKALAVSCQRRGAEVTVVGRRPWAAPAAGSNASSSQQSFPSVQSISKDLSLMRNASALTSELNCNAFDWVVFTNGIFAPPKREATSEGVEVDMAVSFLSRYVFLKTLIGKAASGGPAFGKDRADKSARPRLFVMGYPGAKVTPTLDDFNGEHKYSVFPAHMNTVAANEGIVHDFAARKPLGDVNVYGLAPGLIRTEIRDNLFGKDSWRGWMMESLIGWFTPTPEQYVENTLIHLLASPQLENMNGALIDHKRKIIAGNPFFSTQGNVEKLMTEVDKLAERALHS